MKRVRLVRRDGRAVSPVIATILLVAITVVLAAVLYVMVTSVLSTPPRIDMMTLTVQTRGENWSLEVVTVSAGKLPERTYLLIRDSQGGIALAPTPWANLTMAAWAEHKAFYQDASPAVAEIRAGDLLLVSRLAYPAGSQVAISDDNAILATRSL